MKVELPFLYIFYIFFPDESVGDSRPIRLSSERAARYLRRSVQFSGALSKAAMTPDWNRWKQNFSVPASPNAPRGDLETPVFRVERSSLSPWQPEFSLSTARLLKDGQADLSEAAGSGNSEQVDSRYQDLISMDRDPLFRKYLSQGFPPR